MNLELNYKLMDEKPTAMISTTPVKKRNDKANLKDRFSKIVSVYVPNDDADRVLLNFNDESDFDAQNYSPKTLLQSFDDGISYQVDFIGNFQNILGRNNGIVKTCCVTGSKMFLTFENETQIYRMSINDNDIIQEGIWFPKLHDLSITPIEIRCNENFVYISGTISPTPDVTMYLIVKFNHEENIIACTKRYDYPKFGKFDLDKDGSLIILSPKLEKEEMSSQISKLTSGFESRIFYITLGDSDNQYLPLYVSAHGSDQKSWVSMQKISGDSETIEHRLMCFRCCIDKSDGDKTQLRTKLESSRWRMAGFALGPMTTVQNQVLAIDDKLHNLCHISWSEKEGHPLVKRISAPGSPHLTQLCSGSNGTVYLFTKYSIFGFKFVEQLLKDSEMYI